MLKLLALGCQVLKSSSDLSVVIRQALVLLFQLLLNLSMPSLRIHQTIKRLAWPEQYL